MMPVRLELAASRSRVKHSTTSFPIYTYLLCLDIACDFQGGTSFVDMLRFFCLVFAMPLCASV